ncbi:MAG TPA: OsmC family protein [Chloroflexota bacterium]
MGAAKATTIEVTYQDGMRFDATGQDEVDVAMDSSEEHGGTSSGFRPMELLLVGLGGCAGMDVISILRKKRQDVTAYHIEVSGVPASTTPHVYTSIAIRHILHGNGLSPDAVRRAIELSEKKYCSAYAMLEKAAPITSTFEICPAGPSD